MFIRRSTASVSPQLKASCAISCGQILSRRMTNRLRRCSYTTTFEGVRTFSGKLWCFLMECTQRVLTSRAFSSYAAASAFLERNNLLSVIRAHEAQDAGLALLVCIYFTPCNAEIFSPTVVAAIGCTEKRKQLASPR
jgi:hypothetical protein